MRSLAAAWLLASVSLLCAACSAKPGDGCSIDKNTCQDAHTLLACNTGRYVAIACPGGCVDPSGLPPLCNFAASPPGGACANTDQGKSFCAADGKSRISCLQGHLVTESCKGAGHCTDLDSGQTLCDIDRATVGDYCPPPVESRYACELEGQSQLVCKAGKWTVAQPCASCVIEQHQAVCTKILGR